MGPRAGPPRWFSRNLHHTMALDRSDLLDVLVVVRGGDVNDRFKQGATTISRALIDAKLTCVIGAKPHERTVACGALRNRHRPRTNTTVAGDLELQIP